MTSDKQAVRWIEGRIHDLDPYVYPRLPRTRSRIVEVVGHFSGAWGLSPNGEPRELKCARRSFSFGDLPLRLTEGDLGREFLVRIPWGVSHTGGFVFYARLEALTETSAVFEALYPVGMLDDGSRVYAWRGYRFSLNVNEVRGKEVVDGDAGEIRAQARTEGATVPGPAVPGDRPQPGENHRVQVRGNRGCGPFPRD